MSATMIGVHSLNTYIYDWKRNFNGIKHLLIIRLYLNCDLIRGFKIWMKTMDKSYYLCIHVLFIFSACETTIKRFPVCAVNNNIVFCS